MKKTNAGLALVMMLGLFSAGLPATAQAAAFSDIKGHWAESQIEAMTNRGVIHGYPDGTFHPDAPVAVDEFAVMAWYNVSEVKDGVREFADWWIYRMDETSRYSAITRAGAFHYDQMGTKNWSDPYLVQSDLYKMIPKLPTNETPWKNDFTKPLSREYAAYMLERLVVYAEGFENQTLVGLLKPTVSDIKNIEFPNSEPAILTLMVKGIMTGDPDGNFYPQRTLTRAEALSILERMHNPALRQPRLPDLTGQPHVLVPILDYTKTFLFTSESGLQKYNILNSVAEKFPGRVKKDGLAFYFFNTQQDEQDSEDWFLQNGVQVLSSFSFAIDVNENDQEMFSMLIKNETDIQDSKQDAFDQCMQNIFGDQKKEAKDKMTTYLEKNRNHEKFDETLQIGERTVHLYPHPYPGGSSNQLHLEIK